jgi:hypothetical protein
LKGKRVFSFQACHSREGGNPEVFYLRFDLRLRLDKIWMPAWRGHNGETFCPLDLSSK